MTASPIVETFDGTVSRTNGNGFQVHEREGWLNISKYAMPRPAMPDLEERVRIGLDKAGFVQTLEAIQHGTPVAGPRSQGPHDHDAILTRLGCLKAAAEFLASRSDAKSGDVLKVADSWVGWVTR